MMRSIAASMESSWLSLNEFGGFEPGDRLVGEPDFVDLAALKQLHDDFEQCVVSGESIGNGAGAAQIVRGNSIGVADRLDIHHPQPALDQHGSHPPLGTDKARAPVKFHFWKTGCFGLKIRVKTKRTGRETRTDALGEVSLGCWLPVFFRRRLGRFGRRNSQRRYRIWSVQNRSSRCSDLFRVANSSFEMPPTCSTVLTCF